MEVDELPGVIWVADLRIQQDINGFKQTIGLYTSVEPTGGKRVKYVRATERKSGDLHTVMNTALGVILNYRDVIPSHIVRWAESNVDLSDAEIIPDDKEQGGPGGSDV